LPPRILVLMGKKRYKSRSSRGFEVETKFLGLKDTLVWFPFWQESHNLSFSNFILGKPTTRSLDTILFNKSKWTWLRRLWHNQESSFLAIRHLAPLDDMISRNLDGFEVFILIEFCLFRFLFRTILLQICSFYFQDHKWWIEQKNGIKCMIEAYLKIKLERGTFCQSIAHGRAYHFTDCAPLLKKLC